MTTADKLSNFGLFFFAYAVVAAVVTILIVLWIGGGIAALGGAVLAFLSARVLLEGVRAARRAPAR